MRIIVIEISVGGDKMEHWLARQAKKHPKRVAIETDERQLTFETLYAQAIEIGAKLKTLNTSRLGFYVNNSVEALTCIHASWLYGIEVVMINHRLTLSEIKHQLNSVNVTTIVATLSLELDETFNVISYESISNLASSENVTESPFDAQRIASIMFTSGTTGPQKAVPQRFYNHEASAKECKASLGFSSDSKWLTVLPIYHISGLSIVLRSVLFGFTVYLKESFEPNDILNCIQNKHITHISLVPQTLKRLMDAGLNQPYTLEKILLGGAKLDPTLIMDALNKALPIYNSFGMTETCSQFLTAAPNMLRDRPDIVGCVSENQEIKIKHPNDEGHGVLLVKGHNVMDGYLFPKQANMSTFDEEGYFNTGDIASIDQGYVTIYDRRKDLIISGGENIYPFEIETKAKAFEGVKDAMCVGILDDTWGQRPILYIVSDRGEMIIHDLEQYLRQHLAKYKHPKTIVLVSSLSYTSTGKLQRQVLTGVEK